VSHTSTIYVLHFTPPYVAPIGDTGRVKVAGHYVGSCAGDPEERLAVHLSGAGSPLVRAAVAAGCVVTIAATMPGGRQEERRLKAVRHHARWCPLCRARPLTAPPRARTPRATPA